MTLLSPPRRIALLLLLGLVHSTGVLGACTAGQINIILFGQQDDAFSCATKIDNCEFYTVPSWCIVCNDGYKPAADKLSCIQCTVSHCRTCNSNKKCIACDGNYVPSTDGSACVDQKPGCTGYNADGTCTGCISGYQQSGGSCILCSIPDCQKCSTANQCDTCSTGKIKNGNGVCVTNIPNCKTITDAGVCAACNDGYTLVGSACLECNVPNCDKCEIAANECTQCKVNYILLQKKCITCNVPQCRECSDNDVCAACEDGYGVVDGKCEPCKIEGCLVCTYNAYECSMDLQKATVAKEKKGIPWWVWLIVAIAAAALLGIILFVILWCCLRKPVVPVTVYEEDNYDSEKDSGDDQTRDLELDFNNRSFFARPPPILIMNDYVQPRIYTQDNNEVHGDLSSAAADSEVTSDESGGSSESSRTGDGSESGEHN
ncbi:hypothetical protein, conserved [Angomonas deanei]|uniref:Uncharacterized protein n=1 Tax=Angomonas deanei TaxID=59799 RepID=A0A7G2C9G6_9TRYP|nr:hypothetical protein, conserved [Angomonas deanei]